MGSNFLIVLIICFATQSLASTVMEVERQILSVVQNEVHKECESCVVELRLLNKKIIEDIAIPDAVLADNWKGQTNLVLKVGSEDRIVTAEIRWRDQVVVAKKNIRQGQKIEMKDLRIVEKDVTFLKTAYITEPSKAHGWVGKRVFSRGQIIDENLLKKPLAIRYGQPIKLEMREGSLSLVISAKARGAGAIGDQIPVYIPKTRKKMTAKIISKNTVRIE